MRRQLHRGVDRHRTIRAADDTDRGCFSQMESKELCADQCDKDAQMRSRPQNDQRRIGDHGSEIRHGTDAKKNERRQNELLHALIRKAHRAQSVSSPVHWPRCRKSRSPPAETVRIS